MLSFAAYYKLFESTDLRSFSPTQLGLSNTVQDLPDNRPYGMWIDKHGNFTAAKTRMSHAELAKAILKRAGITPADDHEAYKILFENGFVRVVLTEDEVLYGTYRKEDVTQSQMKLIKFIKEFYDLGIAIFGKEISF
jgi:hypothetical protein